jgi:hypothetical protein
MKGLLLKRTFLEVISANPNGSLILWEYVLSEIFYVADGALEKMVKKKKKKKKKKKRRRKKKRKKV